jgi:hypothetical protein
MMVLVAPVLKVWISSFKFAAKTNCHWGERKVWMSYRMSNDVSFADLS